MQRNSSGCEYSDDIDDHANNTKDRNKRPKPIYSLSKKFRSIVSTIFAKGRSHVGYCCKACGHDSNDHNHKKFTLDSLKMQSFSSVFRKRARTRGKTSEKQTRTKWLEEKLLRVPWRILTTRRRLKMAKSLRKMSSRRIETKPEQNGEGERQCLGKGELCRKRILLGEKCRPLNHSGTLHYDKDGILLPDLIP